MRIFGRKSPRQTLLIKQKLHLPNELHLTSLSSIAQYYSRAEFKVNEIFYKEQKRRQSTH